MVISYLWLFWLPMLFLPNLGLVNETPFGTLTVSDYLVGPYILLLILSLPHLKKAKPIAGKLSIQWLIPIMLLFAYWAALATITIPFRYTYPAQGERQIIFGILKLGKLGLYSLASILTIKAFAHSNAVWQRRYEWALTAIGALIGLTLLISGNSTTGLIQEILDSRPEQVFQENPISVLLSILIVYLTARVIDEHQPSPWRIATSVVLVIMTLGFVFAEGRGGWLAAMAGVAYILFGRTSSRTFSLVIGGALIVLFAYNQFPSFRELVDKTLQPDQEFLREYNAGVFGLDDGSRLIILQTEIPKILNAPLLGTGLFHRGGFSGIFTTGSHNFFLQMFLETGIPGGMLVLILIRQMWRHASLKQRVTGNSSLSTKAALVAAIVSGLSGEYFYGGTILLVLWLTYAPVGAHVIEPRMRVGAQLLTVSNRGSSEIRSDARDEFK